MAGTDPLAMAQRIGQLETDLRIAVERMDQYATVVEEQKRVFIEQVKDEFVSVKTQMDTILAQTKNELTKNEEKYLDMYKLTNDTFMNTNAAFLRIDAKIAEWQTWSSQQPQHGRDRKEKEIYYIPMKNMQPDTFKG